MYCLSRMKEPWDEFGVFEVTEKNLSGQARAIRMNGWLTELEIEEIKQKINKNIPNEMVKLTPENQEIEIEIPICDQPEGQARIQLFEINLFEKAIAEGFDEENCFYLQKIVDKNE